jgi:hypothetical protein
VTDPVTIARFRVSPNDWTRQRTLTFPLVVLLILQGHKQAFQNALNQLFSALGKVRKVPTASALCQARSKLKPEFFVHLNQLVTQSFYQLPTADVTLDGNVGGHVDNADGVWTWCGHRILGVDGTRWNLPNTPAHREHFGSATNQHDAVGCAQGHGSVLYDVLNDIGLHAVLEPMQSEKELMFNHQLKHTCVGDVIVMDRGYADYSVLAFWVKHQREFVVRLPRSSFKAVREFWRSSAKESVVTLRVTPDQRAFVQKEALPPTLRLRLVKLVLENGEIEVLGTSLLDIKRYGAPELGQVYAWRWRVETYLDRLKNIFEIERFGSVRREHLQQDFYGVLFLATLESVLCRPASLELAEQSRRRGCRYTSQVNRAVSYSALLERTLVLLADEKQSVEATLEELHHLFKTNPIPRRPGRHFSHERRTLSQKLRYHRFTKRALT